MRRSIAMLATILTLALLVDAGAQPNGKESQTISQIMLKAHVVAGGRIMNKALDQRVAGGAASEEEKRELAALYQALTRTTPRKGNFEEWKKDTAALAETAQAIVKGDKDALKRLPEVSNCKNCHAKYRN